MATGRSLPSAAAAAVPASQDEVPASQDEDEEVEFAKKPQQMLF